MKYNYFNFKEFADGRFFLTNDFGKYVAVSREEFGLIARNSVSAESDLGRYLINNEMAYVDTDLEYSSQKRYLLRESKGFMGVATSLHIFVVTTACNMGCIYCQACGAERDGHIYMNQEAAERAVGVALQSPAHYLTFEFQGGEPLLNFETIKHIVLYSEKNKGTHEIDYNIVSNLTLLNDEMLDFFSEHSVNISTSIDGPQPLHDANRPYRGGRGTFKDVASAIEMIRSRGLCVGAIQTTTKRSLSHAREIVNAYAELGFDSIFVRPLTPLGVARAHWGDVGYDAEEFVSFYRKVLDETIALNNTRCFREQHASILMDRISGSPVNYMELRSPCGAGVGQLAYYPDGRVFTCDEGRMVYEMGDDAFCLGTVFENDYAELVGRGVCRATCASSILETIPTCCDCVYQPYCGTCPVVNYATSHDVLEKEPRSYRCKLYSGILDYLFEILLADDERAATLRSWSN